ncbi:caspase-8-like isoform X2 [Orussus abietinus]|nr:caspase-8-like isoform X2 [Orussus abietinus]
MFVNEVAKTLYMFCESLSTKQMQLLLKYIREDNGPSDHRLKNVPFLELHILYWAHVGYISTKAGNRWDLTNLLKHLKKLQLTDKSIYGQLEKHKFITTDQWTEILNNDSKSPSPEKEINQPNKNEPVSVANGGLCFIINQMYFPETQYETRYGTDRDRDRLSDTFKQFGFDIEIHNDLTEEEILSALRGIGKKFDKKYNCLVLCILSHGHEDSIISTDGKEIPVAKIESEICCDKLLNVVKVVIIQACREKMSGSAVRDAIIRIGDQDSEAYADFFLFSSTMHGFISCRHKIYGSWFIQTFCKELIFGTKNGGTLLECAASTTKKVITMVKQNGIGRSMPQLPEQRNRLRTHEFKFTYYPNVSV